MATAEAGPFEALPGPAFHIVRIGQLLPTRHDPLPKQLCATLSHRTDETPPPRLARVGRPIGVVMRRHRDVSAKRASIRASEFNLAEVCSVTRAGVCGLYSIFGLPRSW